jgi:hypothetical protein
MAFRWVKAGSLGIKCCSKVFPKTPFRPFAHAGTINSPHGRREGRVDVDSGIISEISTLIVAVTGLITAVSATISVILKYRASFRQRRRHRHD